MRPIGVLFVLLGFLQGGPAAAQELEPRFYSNLLLGLNFLAVGYTRSVGGVLFEPSIELENADLTIDGRFVGYARSIRNARSPATHVPSAEGFTRRSMR